MRANLTTPIAQRGRLSPEVRKGLAQGHLESHGRDGTSGLEPSLLPVIAGTPHLKFHASSLPLPDGPGKGPCLQRTQYSYVSLHVDPLGP